MASASERIREELAGLLNEYEEMLKLIKKKNVLEFGTLYQRWYTRALSVVSSIAPDRLDEFKSLYINPKRKVVDETSYTLQDYIQLVGPEKDSLGRTPYDKHYAAKIRLINQFQILSALRSRLDTVLSDVKGHLFAELQDAELTAASKLMKTSHRAAGALAGVVLERHLQRVATNHRVRISKKEPTIADLNDPLKTAGIYDLPQWRKIQQLADLRNLCSHQKARAPTEDEVIELIDGVSGIIKSVF
jgi:hypothetical protein